MQYRSDQNGINSRLAHGAQWTLMGIFMVLMVAGGKGETLDTGIAAVEALTLDQVSH